MADGSATARTYDSKQIASALGVHKSGVERRAIKEHWQFTEAAVRGGKKHLYTLADLPDSIQSTLLLLEHRAKPPINATCARLPKWTETRIVSAWQRYEAVKQPLKDTAARRMRALHAVAALQCAGTRLMQAREIVAAQMQRDGLRGASAANIARWQEAVDGAHGSDLLALLVPHYAGRTATASIEPAAWDLFKGDWLRLEAPSATSCYDRLQRIASVKPGWSPLPSLITFMRRIARELPRHVRVLARQGEEALMRTYPAQERDRSGFAALEAVNSDGHRWDFNVKFPDGTEGRPSILGWQDLYSGKLLAYRLCDHESSDAVRLSLADLVRRYGVPKHAWLDNGRAFASKWMTGGVANRYRFKVREEDPVGLIVALNIEVHWVTPYHGQAKPIERAWRDFCDRIAKHPAFAGAYVGNSPVNKPANYGSRVIGWDEFVRVVGEEIAAHNARIGRRSKTCAGRSFDETFNASYEHSIVRKVTEEQLRPLLLAAEAVTANPLDGSVRLAGNRYWIEALSAYAGRKVVLRVDPQHLHGSAHVYTLDNTYIAEAPCVARVGFADLQAARETARGKQQYRRASKDMLKAERLIDAARVVEQLPPPPPETLPETAVVEGVFRHHGTPLRTAGQPFAGTGTDDVEFDAMWFEEMKARKREKEGLE
jgi:putative transposase